MTPSSRLVTPMSALPPRRWSQAPGPDLAPFVDRLWGWSLPAGTALPPLFPGTGSEVFFHLASRPRQADGRPVPRGHLLCPRQQTLQLSASGPQQLLAIRFKSGQLRHLTPWPFAELADSLLPVERLWPEEGEALLTALRQPLSQPQQLALLQDFLLRQLSRCQQPHQAGEDALIQRLYYAPNTAIPALADALGWSRRHLERRFALRFGLSPKQFARLARLQHSLRQLALEPELELVQVALARGFCDQAHFSHDSLALTGLTPRQLRQQLLHGPHCYHAPSRRPD
ncbi:helix-turn-helix domain-containing protein [Pseudaeromonas paramecii]|uniref:HTH araC/xylS-type domain-containing protein n=1 Tax=Pseudaeromonas paramecii TaxID=2138166 RepID=A0ABP8QHY4_9GAMM